MKLLLWNELLPTDHMPVTTNILGKTSAFGIVWLIFYSCGVGVSCKSLILQDTEAGFLKSVVPRIVEKCLIIVP